MPTLHATFSGSLALRDATFNPQDEASVIPTGTLTITFTSRRSYTYENVPQTVFEELRDAPSPGSYFHANIKDQF